MVDDEQRRLDRFGRLRPPTFSGTKSEDAQGFLDRCGRMLRTAGILETSGVLFTTFQFFRVAFRWWEAYERRRSVGAAPLIWTEFSVLFLEKFVPQSRREEYEMRFSELARHAVWLVPTDRERIRRDRVSSATFDEVVHIARQIEIVRSQEHGERETKRPRGPSDFNGVASGGQFYHGKGRPYRFSNSARVLLDLHQFNLVQGVVYSGNRLKESRSADTSKIWIYLWMVD
ncbi:uncharacterized protein [Nicotiana tomentosiformis]|uniref:uncharacterized protein n=1 Tax=Nicotiana tomentosiformis TaxID=4098 RepID=UPI00388CA115